MQVMAWQDAVLLSLANASGLRSLVLRKVSPVSWRGQGFMRRRLFSAER